MIESTRFAQEQFAVRMEYLRQIKPVHGCRKESCLGWTVSLQLAACNDGFSQAVRISGWRQGDSGTVIQQFAHGPGAIRCYDVGPEGQRFDHYVGKPFKTRGQDNKVGMFHVEPGVVLEAQEVNPLGQSQFSAKIHQVHLHRSIAEYEETRLRKNIQYCGHSIQK